MAVDTPEDLDSPLASQPGLLASHLAAEKALAAGLGRTEAIDASDHERGTAHAAAPADSRVIVAFDTIVVLDGRVLGKPVSVEDAWGMLRALSGRTHEVVTGVAIAASRAR